MKKDQPELPVAIHDCHQLLAWILPQLDQFPRARRFTLGEKLELLLMEVLENLLEAAYQRGDSKRQRLSSTQPLARNSQQRAR